MGFKNGNRCIYTYRSVVEVLTLGLPYLKVLLATCVRHNKTGAYVQTTLKQNTSKICFRATHSDNK